MADWVANPRGDQSALVGRGLEPGAGRVQKGSFVRSLSRRARWAGLLALVVIGGLGACAPKKSTGAGGPNPIVLENQKLGSDQWQLPWAGHKVADDIGLQIKGFAGQATVVPGHSIGFKVTVNPAQDFSIDVLRLGYYAGKGGRLMRHIGPIAGVHQPGCVSMEATRLLSCSNWSTSFTLSVPTTWITGVYVAVFTNSNNYQSLAPFWVADHSRKSDLLFLSSLNTYAAYNDYPYDPPASDPKRPQPTTGRSLYEFNSANKIPATKVSFDRPFSSQHGGSGHGGLYDFEPMLIAFLEQSGYDVSYTNDVSVDEEPSRLLHHRAVVIAGHAEYWTKAAYDGAETARAKGVGLAFISANEIHWQVRYEANRRVVVGYKDFAPDPVPDPSLRTIRWRDLGRPEQNLIGVQYPIDGNQRWGGQPFVPKNTTHWVYAGSGLTSGHTVKGEIVGYEIDNYDPSVGKPPGTSYTLLAASPFINFQSAGYTHNSSIYKGTGGNWVWATGSMNWSWALAPGGSSDGTKNNVRPELQIVTRTVLNRMIHDAPTPS
jgi:hypothetical protein